MQIFFSVDFNPIDIYKRLMRKTYYKKMFGLIKKMFIRLLTGPINGSNHTKRVWLSNQKCMTQLSTRVDFFYFFLSFFSLDDSAADRRIFTTWRYIIRLYRFRKF